MLRHKKHIRQRFSFVMALMLLLTLSLSNPALAEEETTGSTAAPASDPSTGSADTTVNDSPGQTGSGVSVQTEEEPEPTAVPGSYELVASTDKAALYADMTTGEFVFEDKVGDKLWFSVPPGSAKDKTTKGIRRNQMRSELVVDYVDMRTITTSAVPTSINSYGDSVRNGKAAVKKIPNGIRVEFTFEETQLFVPVEFSLKDDSLSAVVKTSEIKEDSYNHIIALHLLPAFMASKSKDGYLVVPDGSGALANFNNGRGAYAEYDKPVYGEDGALDKKDKSETAKTIAIPAFGIRIGNHALTAIITQGDAVSNICANVVGAGMGYNRVFAKAELGIVDSTTLFEANYFNMRTIYKVEERARTDVYEIRYFASSDQNATYAGMAEIVRNYMLDNALLQKNPAKPSLALDFLGAARKKASFLGIPYETLFSMTTFQQAVDMVNELKNNGVDSVTVRYSGWINSGLKNEKIPTSANPLGLLGGKKGYLALEKLLADSGDSFFSDVDLIDVEKSGHSFSVLSDVSDTLFNTRAKRYEFLRSVYVPTLKSNPWYLLSPQKLPTAMSKFIASYQKAGFRSGLTLNELGSLMYSDFDDGGSERTQTEEYIQQVIQKAGDTPLGVEYGNAYTLSGADRLFEVPMTSSGYLMFDQSIPFMQLILHGVLPYTSEDINLAGDAQTAFLSCMETGSDPYFCGMYEPVSALINTTSNDHYAAQFTGWKEQAAEMYKQYSGVYQKLYDQTITGHRQLSEQVTETTFSNGVKILVNYGGSDYTADGLTAGARNFAVGGTGI